MNRITSGPWRWVSIYRHPDIPGLSLNATNTNDSFFNVQKSYVSGYTCILPSFGEVDLWNGCAKYIEIPKTGSRSLVDALNQKLTNNPSVPFFGHMYGRHFPEYLRGELKTVVRNPYDRLVSSYNFMKGGGFNANGKYLDLSAQFPNFYEFVLEFLNESHMRFGSTIDDFSTRWRASMWREIFVRQSEWLVDDAGAFIIKNSNMARFEYFDSEACRVFGVNNVRMLNSSQGVRPYQEYYARNDVREKVQDLYGPDFDALGYSYAI